MTVKAILSTKGSDVVTISPSATLADAVKLLAQRRIGAVIVSAGDMRIAGILSERDVVHTLAARGAEALNDRVEGVMTRKVSTCIETDTVSAIMETMTHGKFRHLPVVQDGRLVGVVSIGDIVKHRLHEIENEFSALRDYIATA